MPSLLWCGFSCPRDSTWGRDSHAEQPKAGQTATEGKLGSRCLLSLSAEAAVKGRDQLLSFVCNFLFLPKAKKKPEVKR